MGRRRVDLWFPSQECRREDGVKQEAMFEGMWEGYMDVCREEREG